MEPFLKEYPTEYKDSVLKESYNA